MIASDPKGDSIARLPDLWLTSRRSQVLPLRPRALIRGLTGRSGHLTSNAGLREVIESHVPTTRFEQALVVDGGLAEDPPLGTAI